MEYLVALSFRGSQRKKVEKIASLLGKKLGFGNVFFDLYEQGKYKPAGLNADESLDKLQYIFNKSLLSVVLMCDRYFDTNDNSFCNFEFSLVNKKEEWERVYFEISSIDPRIKNKKNITPIDVTGKNCKDIVEEIEERLLVTINTKYKLDYNYEIFKLIGVFKLFIEENKKFLDNEEYKIGLPYVSSEDLFVSFIDHVLDGKNSLFTFLTKLTVGFPEEKLKTIKEALRGVEVGIHRDFDSCNNIIYIEVIEDSGSFLVLGHTDIQSEIFSCKYENILLLKKNLPTFLRRKLGSYTTGGRSRIHYICFIVSDILMMHHMESWSDDQGSIYEMSPNFYRKSYDRIENIDYYADTWRLSSLNYESSLSEKLSDILMRKKDIFEVLSAGDVTSKKMKKIRSNLKKKFCGFFILRQPVGLNISKLYQLFVPSIVIYPFDSNKKYEKYADFKLEEILKDDDFHELGVIYCDFHCDIPKKYLGERLKNSN